ncbi:MBL fold metallo-hydrolase [Piscinibacter gummiphilus]|uniref:MBL fold metallo-hydrolase n=1 Tax=Piscinibacter gummiphilus TaxID=946333 RepID=A0ABZ0CP42_9BURK|nr:MBL fold metallo-hydrolase [Piscinibacter gummiphilus]WOB06654.1 MBL fold metallo-hydrolase [Piscinibacter gummiphilus]
MPIELYNHGGHQCLMFTDLCQEGTEVVQSNQFLIIDGDTGAIIDPGGNLAYGELYLAMTRHFTPQRLSAIFASHADPDIIASLDRWMTATPSAKIYISRVWERFIPHFCKSGKTDGRIVGIPDPGMRVPVGRSELVALPAHFLHSEGNFQFYDPVSRILFSGDLGASMGTGAQAQEFVTRLADHVPRMEGFHRRYMVSNKVMRHWAQMVRSLDIDMIVPQHGSPMRGPAVREFIEWAERLECGIDLLTSKDYRVPA